MISREVTAEVIRAHEDRIPSEFYDEIEREYVRGLVAEDEDTKELTAVVFWELKDMEDENVPAEAELMWLYAENAADGGKLLESIVDVPEYDEITRVFFELPELGSTEKEALTNAGFSVQSAESRDVYVTVGELAALKLSKKPLPSYIKPLSEVNPRQFKAGIMTSVFHGRYGLMDDLPFLPMTRFDPEISCCMITDERINGLLLVHETGMGYLRVELLFALHPDANIHLLNMMRFSIQAAEKVRPSDERVLLRRHNKAAIQVIAKMFPDKKGAPVLRGERKY